MRKKDVLETQTTETITAHLLTSTTPPSHLKLSIASLHENLEAQMCQGTKNSKNKNK